MWQFQGPLELTTHTCPPDSNVETETVEQTDMGTLTEADHSSKVLTYMPNCPRCSCVQNCHFRRAHVEVL